MLHIVIQSYLSLIDLSVYKNRKGVTRRLDNLQYEVHEIQLIIFFFIAPSFSDFISNDGEMGGAVSTAYVPLSFSGFNRFKANKRHSLTVANKVCMFIDLYSC